MSGQKSYATIEDAINDLLEGEHKENALNLAAYLAKNNVSPNMANWGKVRYNDEYNIGRMGVEGKNNWCFEVFSSLHYQYGYVDDDTDFVTAVHDRVSICHTPCHDECWRAKDVKIFGKEFKSVCSQHSGAFVNPNATEIGYIKKLIEYRKREKPYVQQYHSYN
ncbi:MAG: hypothetical protein FWE06_02320 [Oscillospiraceae bacterium]|nr:hypothetical protein [Oscillospiraceae bacterium]